MKLTRTFKQFMWYKKMKTGVILRKCKNHAGLLIGGASYFSDSVDAFASAYAVGETPVLFLN